MANLLQKDGQLLLLTKVPGVKVRHARDSILMAPYRSCHDACYWTLLFMEDPVRMEDSVAKLVRGNTYSDK